MIAVRSFHPRLRFDAQSVVRAVEILETQRSALSVRAAASRAGELSIAFLTDAGLARLHGEYLSDPSPTDVITFAGRPEVGSAGEICVSVDAAARAAGRKKFAEELFLYLAHGWLHLAGHDDRRPDRKRAMRRAEARAVRAVRAAGAMPRFALAAAPAGR